MDTIRVVADNTPTGLWLACEHSVNLEKFRWTRDINSATKFKTVADAVTAAVHLRKAMICNAQACSLMSDGPFNTEIR